MTAWAIHLRGLIAHAKGDYPAALRDFQTCLRHFHENRVPSGISEGFAGISVVAASTGMQPAVRMWGAAERFNDELGNFFALPEREVYERAVQQLRQETAPDVFAAEFQIGRSWSQEQAIAESMALEVPVGPRPGRQVSSRLAVLSPREFEVLGFVASGWTNDRIADHLFLSNRTVSTHLSAILRKLDVANRTEAARLALEHGDF